jgi:hypothetical protein
MNFGRLMARRGDQIGAPAWRPTRSKFVNDREQVSASRANEPFRRKCYTNSMDFFLPTIAVILILSITALAAIELRN